MNGKVHSLTLLSVFLFGLTVSCSNIEFEFGPYSIQEMDIVYSEQEDVTFLTWRLREDADLDRVRFEVKEGDVWENLDLEQAIFPSAPFRCGASWCFQYQWDGYRSWTGPPLRSVHEDEGYFASREARTREVGTTISIEPIALGKNDSIDPVLKDGVASLQPPTRRNFDWELRTGAFPCEGTALVGGELSPFAAVSDPTWVEVDACLVVWAKRRDERRLEVFSPVKPAAQTFWVEARYTPEVEEAPIAYNILFDLEIPSPERCREVQDTISDLFRESFGARGELAELGTYYPVDPSTGESFDGCAQSSTQDYPTSSMIRDADVFARRHDPSPIKVIWIYVNNIDVPPNSRLEAHFNAIGEEEFNRSTFVWGLGANGLLQSGLDWGEAMGWRPIEDRTLSRDIRARARAILPFKTMLHDNFTRVKIEPPEAEVEKFKLCASNPLPIQRIGLGREPPTIYGTDVVRWVPWTDEFEIFYFLEGLEEQRAVPNNKYIRYEIVTVFEFCTRFCANPFRTQGGLDVESWTDPQFEPGMQVCQWEG